MTRRLQERRHKPQPDLADLVRHGCKLMETPRGADFLIDLYFAVDRKPCQLCPNQCFTSRGNDRRQRKEH